MTDLVVETAEIPHLGGTPYAGFAVRAHAALIEEGLSDPRDVLVWPMQSAIVARLSVEEPIGILTFDEDRLDILHIYIAFVTPDFHRRGVFRLMHDELVKTAERLGATRIEFATSPGNTAMARTAAATGFRLVTHGYRMDVAGG